MKKVKLNFGILVLAMTLVVAISTSAFTPAVNMDDTGIWYFEGSTASSAASWERVQQDYTCGEFTSEPCEIDVPEGKTLQQYLNENSADLLAISNGRRE